MLKQFVTSKSYCKVIVSPFSGLFHYTQSLRPSFIVPSVDSVEKVKSQMRTTCARFLVDCLKCPLIYFWTCFLYWNQRKRTTESILVLGSLWEEREDVIHFIFPFQGWSWKERSEKEKEGFWKSYIYLDTDSLI